MEINRIVVELKSQQSILANEIKRVNGEHSRVTNALRDLTGAPSASGNKSTGSTASKTTGNKTAGSSGSNVKKFTMSPEARKKIADAQRKRWAGLKKAGNTGGQAKKAA